MRKPTVHLNGTSRAGLRDPLLAARSALRAALEALDEAAPNARDYYVQGNAAYGEARSEHEARREKVKTVMGEMTELADHVLEGAP